MIDISGSFVFNSTLEREWQNSDHQHEWDKLLLKLRHHTGQSEEVAFEEPYLHMVGLAYYLSVMCHENP